MSASLSSAPDLVTVHGITASANESACIRAAAAHRAAAAYQTAHKVGTAAQRTLQQQLTQRVSQRALLPPDLVDVGAKVCSDNRLLMSGLPAQNISHSESS